jgi:hypothetical protein
MPANAWKSTDDECYTRSGIVLVGSQCMLGRRRSKVDGTEFSYRHE